MPEKPLWDIFCVVVDNFGDIGVTWRLARQLVAEHGMRVRLWVDDLTTFARLCPEANDQLDQQYCSGVDVRYWPREWVDIGIADVVIEAFACEVPAGYTEAMRTRQQPTLWLNLEYLSAEDWTVSCHALPSPQFGGLQKFFFFPGFETRSGGLLRESGLLDRRRAFQADPEAQAGFLRTLDVSFEPGSRCISLFAYENAAISDWLSALASEALPTWLLVPEGRVLGNVAGWLGIDDLKAGDRYQRDSLRIAVIPFLSQDDYDRLLWCCDFNAVRGEESFIRAQWAGRPMVWHIYPQEEGAHWSKLDAFLELYLQGLSQEAQGRLKGFWHAWNSGHGAKEHWCGLQECWPELLTNAELWVARQEAHGDLAGKLVSFYLDWL